MGGRREGGREERGREGGIRRILGWQLLQPLFTALKSYPKQLLSRDVCTYLHDLSV